MHLTSCYSLLVFYCITTLIFSLNIQQLFAISCFISIYVYTQLVIIIGSLSFYWHNLLDMQLNYTKTISRLKHEIVMHNEIMLQDLSNL